MMVFHKDRSVGIALAGALMLGGAQQAGAADQPPASTVRPFTLVSTDGAKVLGQADLPPSHTTAAVILVAGTGSFDRDVVFGKSGTERDKVFKDFARRFNQHGLMAVRYDKRGVRYGVTGADRFDRVAALTNTTTAQRDDLRAVYDWARSPQGLGARCVVFFAHSEGMAHVGRLAASGAPAPDAVIGMGGLMEAPQTVLRWQMAERDLDSIALMDSNHDGVVTNAEIRENWKATPAGAGELDPLLSPKGAWTKDDLARERTVQRAAYEAAKDKALATSDSAPYPNAEHAEHAVAPYQWWKSWYSDDTPAAVNLAHWRTRFDLHYGSIDSQTVAARQAAAAIPALSASPLRITVHPGVGHGLGPHPLLGPPDEAIADQIAAEAGAICSAKT